MASVFTAQTINIYNPIVVPNQVGICYVNKGIYTVSAALIINDIVKLNILPAGCVPVDFSLIATDLDSATTMTVSVGLWDGTTGLVASSEFIVESAVAQAGGVARMASLNALLTIVKATTDQYIALKVIAAPTSTAITTGYFKGILFYQYAEYGI